MYKQILFSFTFILVLLIYTCQASANTSVIQSLCPKDFIDNVEDGATKEVINSLNSGIDPNCSLRAKAYLPPLFVAADQAETEIVKALLVAGADPDAGGWSSVRFDDSRYDVGIIQLIQTARAKKYKGTIPKGLVLQIESVSDVVALLDITSFSNSIGPRREANKKTFLDYDINHRKYTFDPPQGHIATSHTVAIQDDGWEFIITLLSASESEAIICFEDVAKNGGSYHTKKALELRLGNDGLLKAIEIDGHEDDCRPIRPK